MINRHDKTRGPMKKPTLKREGPSTNVGTIWVGLIYMKL